MQVWQEQLEQARPIEQMEHEEAYNVVLSRAERSAVTIDIPDPKRRPHWATISMMEIVAADGKVRRVLCLHIDCSSSRVKEQPGEGE